MPALIHNDLEEFWLEFLGQSFASDGGGLERIFRGVTDKDHELVPSIGRSTEAGTSGDISTLERDLMEEFKRLSVPELTLPPTSEFEWLFLAQHYGLPTRLLDWSSNPLVALFFAVERKDEVDGAVYMVRHAVSDQYELFDYHTADYTKETKKVPFSMFAIQPSQGTVVFVRPKYTDRRYQNQKSIFSCPEDPFRVLEIDGLKKLEFSGRLKPALRSRLRTLGIATSFICPGLGGVASEAKCFHYDPVTSGRMKIVTASVDLKL